MRQKINNFLLQETGIKKSSKKAYKYRLLKFARFLDFKEEFNKKDILRFLNKAKFGRNKDKFFEDLKIRSQNLYIYILRKFLRYLNKDFEYLKPKKPDPQTVRRRDLLTPKEIKLALSDLKQEWEKCMFMLFLEGGIRLSELRHIKIGDIEDKGTHHVIWIEESKTRKRPITYVESQKYIKNWLNKHPVPKPSQYLFVHKWRGEIVRYSKRRIQEVLANIDSIEKHIHPHLLRHTCVTRDRKSYSDKALILKHGWNSRNMLDTYDHLVEQEDLERKALELHGIVPEKREEKPHKIIKDIECPRCEEVNKEDQKYCSKCGSLLQKEKVIEFEKFDKKIEEKEINKELLKELFEDFLKKKGVKDLF
jgi:integrase